MEAFVTGILLLKKDKQDLPKLAQQPDQTWSKTFQEFHLLTIWQLK